MKAHKHANLMMEYAKDALETDKPWELWEVKTNITNGWAIATRNLEWHNQNEYRRKPQGININGYEVPEPMRTPPKYGECFYLVQLGISPYYRFEWDSLNDIEFLEKGLCHSTPQAAAIHANALLSFTKGGAQ